MTYSRPWFIPVGLVRWLPLSLRQKIGCRFSNGFRFPAGNTIRWCGAGRGIPHAVPSADDGTKLDKSPQPMTGRVKNNADDVIRPAR
jgi:hypothetical protein